MFRRVSRVCLLFAWLCASGALLDVEQIFAWTRMFAGYAGSMSFAEAASRTLDPDKPCELCKAVRKARENDCRQQPANVSDRMDKTILVCQVADRTVYQSLSPEWPEAAEASLFSWCRPVPVPPPRIGSAIEIG